MSTQGRFVNRLLNKDELTGISNWFVHDTKEDSFQIISEQETEPILEANYEARNQYGKNKRFGKAFATRVASIPLITLRNLMKTGEHPSQDQNAFAKWLDRAENKVFRIHPGKMSR